MCPFQSIFHCPPHAERNQRFLCVENESIEFCYAGGSFARAECRGSIRFVHFYRFPCEKCITRAVFVPHVTRSKRWILGMPLETEQHVSHIRARRVSCVACIGKLLLPLLQDTGTHILRKLCVIVCHSPFFRPAPLVPHSHKQWLAKGGHLASWGNATALKRNAFIVFRIKQQTCM